MPYYRAVGTIPRKRHTRAVDDDGAPLAEELLGTEGFHRDSALLYHRASPSAIVAVEQVEEAWTTRAGRAGGVGPRHFRTSELPDGAADAITGRLHLLGNDDVTIAFVSATDASPLHRCVVGDELVYVHRGGGRLDSVFGALDVDQGDYVVVPAGATHRWVPGSAGMDLLVIETTGHVRTPDRYLTPTGQFLEGAPYSERDLRAPAAPLVLDGPGDGPDGSHPVLVRSRTGWQRYWHATHPFDVVGWDGCLYPHAVSIHDFEPIVGRIHQPPPVHQTFALPGAVVCSFVPRPLDFDEDAVTVPYHHHNVDSDEVLFYADGEFSSRAGSGIGVGSVSFHPAGFTHGPQPGSAERADAAKAAGQGAAETAVMVDTFQPLHVLEPAAGVEDPDYHRSWLRAAPLNPATGRSSWPRCTCSGGVGPRRAMGRRGIDTDRATSHYRR